MAYNKQIVKLTDIVQVQINQLHDELVTARIFTEHGNPAKVKAYTTWLENTNEVLEFVNKDDFYGLYQKLQEWYK